MMHKKEQPLISICIPTYNGESFLEEALDSIVNQTYRNIEVVFSDDASADNTLGIIDKFKSQSNLPIYVFNHLPKGIASNWNHTLEKANGKYIKIRHDSMYQSAYMHLNNFAVNISKGKQVKKGELIGYMGQTGAATGSHLCFRFYKNGLAIDPRKTEFPKGQRLGTEMLGIYYHSLDTLKVL